MAIYLLECVCKEVNYGSWFSLSRSVQEQTQVFKLRDSYLYLLGHLQPSPSVFSWIVIQFQSETSCKGLVLEAQPLLVLMKSCESGYGAYREILRSWCCALCQDSETPAHSTSSFCLPTLVSDFVLVQVLTMMLPLPSAVLTNHRLKPKSVSPMKLCPLKFEISEVCVYVFMCVVFI